ncbi:hypothetical protein SLEP1_g12103 [Rubroshorea leprosula]|nr:hypothetical protein SLEP1_g12103 [Rubroshorea leprosula]
MSITGIKNSPDEEGNQCGSGEHKEKRQQPSLLVSATNGMLSHLRRLGFGRERVMLVVVAS